MMFKTAFKRFEFPVTCNYSVLTQFQIDFNYVAFIQITISAISIYLIPLDFINVFQREHRIGMISLGLIKLR